MSAAIPSPAACCSPCEDQVTTQIPGAPGKSAYQVAVDQGFVGTEAQWLASLDGAAGENAFTELTAAFTVPNAGSPDIAEVTNSEWASVDQILFLEGPVYLAVVSIPDSTHIELDNMDYPGNLPDGAVIPIGSRLGPAGLMGLQGEPGTGSGDMLSADNLAVGPTGVANASTALTNLGGSVVGKAIFGVASPSAIRFFRVNADNTVTLLSDSDTRIALGLVVGTNVQAYDADLTTWAGITPSANAVTFISAANNSAMRTALGVIADNFALYEHQQASGVDGGDFANGAWRTVPINTEVSDANGIGTLAANAVTLQAGTYRFRGWTNAYSVTNSQARLYNVTTTSVVSYGRCSISAGASTQFLLVEGKFTIGGACAFRIEAQCSVTEAVDGFGKALSFGGTEIYAGLAIIKE